jgi:filamentous hemagglutinin
MSNTVLIKRSGTPNAVPSTANLALGELAINTYDGRLYTKIDTGTASVYELTQNQPIQVLGNVTGNSVNTGNGTSNITLTLTSTGVAAGTYGGSVGPTSNIGVFTVDQYGRITSASNVAISTSSLSNGTSNIEIANSANISITVAGTPNVAVFANTGVYVTGVTSASGNVTGANLFTAGIVSATGNITGGNIDTLGNVAANGVLTDNYYYANGSPVDFQQAAGANGEIQFNLGDDFAASANLAFDSANSIFTVTGQSTVTGNITGGNVTTAGKANIGTLEVTGTGSITGNLTVTANIAGGNLSTAGLASIVGNITGGNIDTAGQVVASGNITGGNLISNALVQGVTVSASGNAIAGNVNTSGLVSATGNVIGGNLVTAGLATVTGNITGGNIDTAGLITATGNITGGNVNTLGLLSAGTASVTGNTTSGNLLTGGIVSATGNITTGGLITAVGNITGANMFTAGDVSAAGNVNGNNINAVNAVVGNIDVGNIQVTGNIIVNSVTSNTFVTAAGNVLAGQQVSAVGNITGGNIATAGLVTVTGNVTAGNFDTAGLITAVGNITGGNITTTGVVTTSNVTSIAGLTVTTANGDINLWPTSGNIKLANTVINNLASPIQSTDAVTKQYVDDAVSSGITIHTPVYVESPTALAATYAQGGTTHTVTDIANNAILTLSAVHGLSVNDQIYWTSSFNGVAANTSYFVYSVPTNVQITLTDTYNGVAIGNLVNGTGLSQTGRANPGVGATLTSNVNGAVVIDGVTLTTSQRVLVYEQIDGAQNGVYTVTDTGNVSAPWVMTRATDMDRYIPDNINGIDAGDYFYVQAGNTGAGESYVLTAPVGEIIPGYDSITFTQFSASQVYSAGNGLSLTGTVFSVNVDNDTTAIVGGNVIVKTSANLVTPNIGAAVGNSLTVTGNISGANISVSGLFDVVGNITGGNISTAGNVLATGNILGANAIITANVVGGNIITTGLVSATGNITGGNLVTPNTANVGTLVVNTFANILATTISVSNVTGALRVAGGVGVTGNVYADGVYVLGDSVLTVNSTVDGGTY